MSYKASVMGRLPFGGAHRGPGDGGGRARGDPDLWDGAGSGGRASTVLEDRGTQPLKGVEGTWRGSDPASGAF
jgi:hypothetical protein